MNTQRFKILQYEINDVAANGDTILIHAGCDAQCENGLIFWFGLSVRSEEDVTGACIEGYPIISLPAGWYHIRTFQENDINSPSMLVWKLFLEDKHVRLDVEWTIIKIKADIHDLHAYELSLSKIAELGLKIWDMVTIESLYRYDHFYVAFEVTKGTDAGEIWVGVYPWFRG